MRMLRLDRVPYRPVHTPGFMIRRPQVIGGEVRFNQRRPGQLSDFPDTAVASAPDMNTASR